MKPLQVNPVFNGAYMVLAMFLMIVGSVWLYNHYNGLIWVLCVYMMVCTALFIYLMVVYLRYLDKKVLITADERGITITKYNWFVAWADVQEFYLEKDFKLFSNGNRVEWYLHIVRKQGKPCCINVSNLSLLPHDLWDELDKRFREHGDANGQ